MKSKYTINQVSKAIKGSGGIISTIASRLGCDWNTAHRYVTVYKVLQTAYETEREGILDVAESVVMHNINLAARKQQAQANMPPMEVELVDTGDAKWYLSRKGKGRGYFERVENLNRIDNLAKAMKELTDDQLSELERKLEKA